MNSFTILSIYGNHTFSRSNDFVLVVHYVSFHGEILFGAAQDFEILFLNGRILDHIYFMPSISAN